MKKIMHNSANKYNFWIYGISLANAISGSYGSLKPT